MAGGICSERSVSHSGVVSCLAALKTTVIKDGLNIDSENTHSQVKSLRTRLQ